MRDGFIKVAVGVPEVAIADTKKNTESIKELICLADQKYVNILVLPELCITGYSCGDLFFNEKLIISALNALKEIRDFTQGKYPIVAVGLPIKYNSKLFNCAAIICGGEILGIVPKQSLPNNNEFAEKRYFISGDELPNGAIINIDGEYIPLGNNSVFTHSELDEFTFAVELCEDINSTNAITENYARFGANIIINLAASNEVIGKADLRRNLISAASFKSVCGYACASAGVGETTQDTVFSGHSLIYENGKLLAENKPFENNKLTVSEIDVKNISFERRKNTEFSIEDSLRIYFNQEIKTHKITRTIKREPFLPKSSESLSSRAEEILQIQSQALARRLSHTHSKTAVIGISGGLDSTLALLATARAMKLLSRPLSDILAITMPCFGTTKRTRTNSEILCNLLGVSFKEINITEAVKCHFADIEQNETELDVTFENSQARERTQVLMDIANKTGGIVIGTGDLSELALGWATYNGDHMSMYGVNSGLPKTLIRFIVKYEADISDNGLKKVLYDILNTPVSPELLPTDNNGEIAQKTEDLVGPYELHDFFLYHIVRFGETPKKIFRLATHTFGEYDKKIILKWLTVFTKRFFNQQFKRSCSPDGVKIGSVSLSPRGDWKMPSDAFSNIWIQELEEIEKTL